ncbi:MAG TPA: glucosaminidase domain-containing protein, partial [Flavisolibacter sp.]|nr:glucosaminidase domain-containing protein [Flavisolibacter sp.]
MKKLPLLVCLFFACTVQLFAQSSSVIKAYIATYRDIAIAEMQRTGVPASITLAQGIHETQAGQSKLVLKSNNHFGIKCKSEWKGESVSHDDDARGECFRKYTDPADSYKDHSDFLKNRAHYASLFTLDPTDFEGWAYGLKKAGYATNPKYPQILIRIIKDYNLQDYTLVALGRKALDVDAVALKPAIGGAESVTVEEKTNTKPRKNYPEGVFQINRTNVVYVIKSTPYLALAQEYKIPLRRLFEFNDLAETEMTGDHQLVFIQRKRREGATPVHKVEEGETLHDIAQAEAIQLESLLSYNYLRSDVAPSPGRELYLTKGEGKKTERVSLFSFDKPRAFNTAAPAGGPYVLHTVQTKQSLYAISKMYEVSVEDI